MDEQKAKCRWVSTITDFAQMRFTPEQLHAPSTGKANEKLVEKIRTMLPWSPRPNASSASAENPEEEPECTREGLPQLKFARKLTAEHILIGNHNQLDLISIHSATLSFLDTSYLWSISLDSAIDLICVDSKKSLLILGNKDSKKISVFRYDPKKIHKKPVNITDIIVKETPEDISILKDVLIVITETKISSFTITPAYEILPKAEVEYQFPVGARPKVFRVPQPVENHLNIFFSEDKPHSSVFVLWVVELEYVGYTLRMSPAEKIYDIKKSLKNKIKIRNSLSKESFIMNLGTEILTFKKGYIIDSVNISMKIENSHLKYIGYSTLIHFSNRRFEIYDYELRTNVKPFKIYINPRDSMQINLPANAEFFDAISVFNNNILIILQVSPIANRKVHGEFNYYLALTQPILLEDKIDMLFPARRLPLLSEADLNNRIEMASKMGMTNRDIYLELWNRSEKVEKNFPLLISTRDYSTIHNEVVRLLKKKSMHFSEVFKIERSSFEMLKEYMFSPACTKEVFFGYISSNYLLKKLEYFRDMVVMNQNADGQQPLFISIKAYNDIMEMHLINHIITLAKEGLNSAEAIKQLRLFLYHFHFELRTVYNELLGQLLRTLKGDFRALLEAVPEILPYEHSEEERMELTHMPSGCYDGIWRPLSHSEKKETMCIDNVLNIDNRDVIQEAIKDLWFRRANMFGHCFIPDTLQQVEEEFETLNSQNTFFNVIELVIKEVDSSEQRRKIFGFIETKYRDKLSHLHNRINLYNLIYEYLDSRNILPLNEAKLPYSFREFLSLRDDMLMLHLFKTEKTRKGLLLKEIKPIFDRHNREGQNLFNDSLLNYFKSQVSEVSDIKYLLNRINNERREFHMSNQAMYSVLVEAMTIKLMVGTGDDIPLSEILIYIENIPLDKNNDVLNKLATISSIHRNCALMQEAHINMSVVDIINNPQQMMIRVIDHLLAKFEMYSQTQSDKQFEISYHILATLEYLHNEIYKDESESTFYIFFIYLVRLAERKSTVAHIRALIEDTHLSKEFNYDPSIVESLVVYLYKARLNEQPEYHKNFDYLRTILTLLPQDNEIREYIICEFEIAQMLSSALYRVQYPLSYRHSSLGMPELEEILSNLKADEVLAIPIDELTTLILQMYNLNSRICAALNFIEDEDKSELLSSVFYRNATSELTRKQVYEVFMLRVLSLRRLRELLPIMEKYFEDPSEIVESDIIYPMMLLIEMEQDLNHECRELLFIASCYLFKDPAALFRLIQQFMTTPFSTRERVSFLRSEVLVHKRSSKGFNIENKVINPQIISIAILEGLENNLFSLLVSSYRHLVSSRGDFHQYMFAFLYAIMINSPYVLAKFLLCSRKYNAVRNLRLFLTYIFKEKTFEPLATLEVGYRVFMLVLYCLRDEMELEEVAHRFIEYPLDEALPIDFEPEYDPQIHYFQLLAKSSHAFKTEKQIKMEKILMELDLEDYRSKQMLLEPDNVAWGDPIEHSDIDMEESGEERKSKIVIERKPAKFNEGEEIKKAINSKVKGRRNNKKALQKKTFEEDIILGTESLEQDLNQDFEGPIIRILPEIGSDHEDSSHMIKEYFEDLPLFEVPKEKEDSKNHSFDSKLKDLIKKSPLSARDEEEKPSMSDAEAEKESPPNLLEKLIGGVADRVRPERNDSNRDFSPKSVKPKLINVYYDNTDSQIAPAINEVPKKDFDRISVKSGGDIAQTADFGHPDKKSERKSSMADDEVRSNKGMKKSLPLTRYAKVDGFPSVEEAGKKLYQANLIAFENAKKRKYKLEMLNEYEGKPYFDRFIQEIIKYLYYESNDSSLEGIIGIIETIILKYKLPIDTNHLNIWKRSEKLYKRYDSDSSPRKTLPIEAIFGNRATPQEIYKFMEPQILESINDVNVYKIAKIMGMTFVSDAVEHEVIYNYLLILSQRYTNEADTEAVNEEHEKLAVVIKKIPCDMLSARFNDFYSRADFTKKKQILQMVVEKVKKLGSKEQKIELLKQVVEFEPAEAGFLERLTRKK